MRAASRSMSPRSIRFESSTSSAAVRSGWRPISRRKSWSASVVVSTVVSMFRGGAVGSLTVLRRLDDLDVSLLELAVEGLDRWRLELERVDRLVQLHAVDPADSLGAIEQRLELGGVGGGSVAMKRVTVALESAVPGRGPCCKRPRDERTVTGVMSSSRRSGFPLGAHGSSGPSPSGPVQGGPVRPALREFSTICTTVENHLASLCSCCSRTRTNASGCGDSGPDDAVRCAARGRWRCSPSRRRCSPVGPVSSTRATTPPRRPGAEPRRRPRRRPAPGARAARGAGRGPRCARDDGPHDAAGQVRRVPRARGRRRDRDRARRQGRERRRGVLLPYAPLAKKIGTARDYYRAKAAVKKAHAAGLYVIGRVVVFEDPR